MNYADADKYTIELFNEVTLTKCDNNVIVIKICQNKLKNLNKNFLFLFYNKIKN